MEILLLAAGLAVAFLLGCAVGTIYTRNRLIPSRTADPIEPLCTENLSTHILPRSVHPREEG